MNNLEITAFLIHLGPNMWGKKDSEKGRGFYIDIEDSCFKEKMVCNREVWRKVTDFLPQCGINTIVIDVADGIKYKSHPEIALPDAWNCEELKQELCRLRSIGLTPIPKCNFSTAHSAWMKEHAYSVGTEEHIDFCKDIINELIDLFDFPKYFHLGLEEETAEAQMDQTVSLMRSTYKWAQDANDLFDTCRARGVRPWIWTSGEDVAGVGGDEAFREYVGKDVLLSNWYYGIIRYGKNTRGENVFADYSCRFAEWGYEQVPTGSTWEWHLNNKDIMRFCKNEVDKKSIKGYMTASWMQTTDKKLYALLNDAFNFGNAIKDIYG